MNIWTELVQRQTGMNHIGSGGGAGNGKKNKQTTCRLLNPGGRWRQTVMRISAMLGHSNQRLSSACIYCVNACRTLIFSTEALCLNYPLPPVPQNMWRKETELMCIIIQTSRLIIFFPSTFFCRSHTEYPTLLFLMIIIHSVTDCVFFFQACLVAWSDFR